MTTFKLRGYSVVRLLGRGASSEVWRARVAATGEPVALKRLLRTDSDQLSRAHAEAALLTVLDHPNLVRLHSVVSTPEAPVLVLDLADGGSLAELLSGRGRLAPGEVVTAVAPVAAALAYVHRQGVVHGDVSAANLLFTTNGTALLADLGVARLTGDMADAESTPAYVDPAVANGSPPATVSDVFMLAAVAFHALTGEPVWSGRTADELLASARGADVSRVPDRLAAAGVPPEVAAVVVRALTIDPRARGTATDFALDLRSSATPVAVELFAGRGTAARARPVAGRGEPQPKRRAGYEPRHAAQVGARIDAPAVTDAQRLPPSASGSSEPDDEAAAEPAALLVAPASAAPSLPPTTALNRPRPVIPRPPRRRRFSRLHVLVTATIASVALAVPAALYVGQGASGRDSSRRSVAANTDWAAALHGLDRERARAFATRDPRLLDRVYSTAALRTVDRALLAKLVPEGCSLRGATTAFTSVRVIPDRHRAVVTVRAGIGASTLTCAGRVDRRIAPVPAATVRVDLVMTPAGVRIADLRRI